MKTKKEQEEMRKLKEMIQEKPGDETVEQILVKFCARSGVSLEECRRYYNHLVNSGEIKES